MKIWSLILICVVMLMGCTASVQGHSYVCDAAPGLKITLAFSYSDTVIETRTRGNLSIKRDLKYSVKDNLITINNGWQANITGRDLEMTSGNQSMRCTSQ